MSYCSKCGAQVNDDATYCHKCGSPLENNSPGGQNPWYIKPVEPTRNNNGMNRFAILGFFFFNVFVFYLTCSRTCFQYNWSYPDKEKQGKG